MPKDKNLLLDLGGTESKSQMLSDHVKMVRFSLANRERAVKTVD